MTAGSWNFADLWETVAAAIPDAPAIIHGTRQISWSEFDRRANSVARDLARRGLGSGDRLAVLLPNSIDHALLFFASFKIGLTPVNLNYRYGPTELQPLVEDAGCRLLVYESRFAEAVGGLVNQLPGLAAADVASVGASESDSPLSTASRSGEDRLFMYTGGTTGRPKAVVWTHNDLFIAMGAGGQPVLGLPPFAAIEDVAARAAAGPSFGATLIVPPLMHGAGQFNMFIALANGGPIAFLPGQRFDASILLDEIERLRARTIVLAGSAFVVPLVEELHRTAGRRDIASVRLWRTSAAMVSAASKQALLGFTPEAAIFDSMGASEAVGVGSAVTRPGDDCPTGRFILGPNAEVLHGDGRPCEPGEEGLLAVRRHIPTGYFGDPERSRKAFPTLGAERWAVPGDWALRNADRSFTLRGRGSQCINSGGEKIFVEEVEEALKAHPGVSDALVLGVPDKRFGEIVAAVVQGPVGGSPDLLLELQTHARGLMASYKIPRRAVAAESLPRLANGKPDYRTARTLIERQLKYSP